MIAEVVLMGTLRCRRCGWASASGSLSRLMDQARYHEDQDQRAIIPYRTCSAARSELDLDARTVVLDGPRDPWWRQ